MKKKISAFLLCVSMIAASSFTAFADDPAVLTPDKPGGSASVSTEVPAAHKITVIIKGEGKITLDGSEGTEFDAARLSEPEAAVIPADGWKLLKVEYNDEDVTSRLTDGKFKLPPVNKDGVIKVEFDEEPAPPPPPPPDDGGKDTPPSTGVVGGISIGSAALLTAFVLIKRRSRNSTEK